MEDTFGRQGGIVKRLRSILALLTLVTGMTFSTAGSVGASDGQMLCSGSSVFTDVYVSGGKATVAMCNPPVDCPTYVTNCHVYVRWLSKCEWLWCTTFDDRSGWILADDKTVTQWCTNGKQQYKLEYKTTFLTGAQKTMKAYGSNESLIEIGGGFIYRLIAHGWFNYTNQTGWSVGTLMKTITAVSGETDPGVVATSGGSWITLSC